MLFYLTFIDNDIDKDFFEQIYLKYKKRMLYVANGVLHDQFEAEDAVHNALIGIAKNISTVKNLEASKVGSYLLSAAYNAALNLVKNKSPIDIDSLYNSTGALENIPDDDFFVRMQIKEKYDEVIDEIKLLKPIYREVLYRHYVLELSVKQIAHILNEKPRTVEKQIYRGKQILLNNLEASSNERSRELGYATIR